jgi:hypothetical protein
MAGMQLRRTFSASGQRLNSYTYTLKHARPTSVKRIIPGDSDNVFEFVEAVLDIARDLMHEKVEEALRAQVSIGNSTYILGVDGKRNPKTSNVVDFTSIRTARKKVNVSFLSGVISLVIGDIARELEAAIGKTAVDTGALRASVVVFYGGPGKNTRNVTTQSQIKEFYPGDWLEIYPSVRSVDKRGINYFPYVNAAVRKRVGKGFMAQASAMIRRRIRMMGASARLVSYVGRSRAIPRYDKFPPDGGRPVKVNTYTVNRRIQRGNPNPRNARKVKPFPGTAIAGVPVIRIVARRVRVTTGV